MNGYGIGAACHNSPHAWYPSLPAVDNQQPINLQGISGPLGEESCLVCHTQNPGNDGPHEGDGADDDRLEFGREPLCPAGSTFRSRLSENQMPMSQSLPWRGFPICIP